MRHVRVSLPLEPGTCDLELQQLYTDWTIVISSSAFTVILNLFEAIESCVIDLHLSTFSDAFV